MHWIFTTEFNVSEFDRSSIELALYSFWYRITVVKNIVLFNNLLFHVCSSLTLITLYALYLGKPKDKPVYADNENLPDDVGINLSEIRTRNLRKREAHKAKLGRYYY